MSCQGAALHAPGTAPSPGDESPSRADTGPASARQDLATQASPEAPPLLGTVLSEVLPPLLGKPLSDLLPPLLGIAFEPASGEVCPSD
jgi:hypothetical protein